MGTLWEGRFKSTLVDTESYLLTLYRYIELNPVRARMVEHPAAYPWSSYQGNAGDRNITLMTPHPLYFALGSTLAERKSAYQSPFLSHLSDTLSRRAKPSPKGGDRRSKSFKTSKIKRILFFNEPCILNPCKT